jgi:hypothetical protein
MLVIPQAKWIDHRDSFRMPIDHVIWDNNWWVISQGHLAKISAKSASDGL